ncbi:hypothetical protein A6R68_01305 [Neotoma lepida]|uniref:Uncharacterized protein n=1 Tax=Neotoma lepida TaxID=56216 RepID=A0A1A6GVF5_NEOLE|nr:hypothetical protein A6R68_01305 [Neotoma lepida]
MASPSPLLEPKKNLINRLEKIKTAPTAVMVELKARSPLALNREYSAMSLPKPLWQYTWDK